jgi:hypothetical protein
VVFDMQKERKFVANTPIPPKVEMIRNPIDEQLAHVLEIRLNAVPEKTGLLSWNLECSKTYTFMLMRMPNNIEVITVRMNPLIASSGR